jgi:hypothetical protein
VKEYLADLEAEVEPNPDRKPPKVISPSDPQSVWTAKANKRVQFGYGLNYLIDGENAVIVDVEPTRARTYDEVEATKKMLDRTERRLGLKAKRLAADTAYGTGRFLAGWSAKGLRRISRFATPAIVLMAHSHAATFVGTDDEAFTSALMTRCCIPPERCMTAKCFAIVLQNSTTTPVRKKMKCCPNTPARQVPRDINEYSRDVARRLIRTKAFLRSRDERKRVEMRFARLKVHHRFERTLALRTIEPPAVLRTCADCVSCK